MTKKWLLLVLISFISVSMFSQPNITTTDEKKVVSNDRSLNVLTINSTINTFYSVISGEKGQPRDWSLFKFLFHPEAKLITSGKDNESNFQIRFMKPDDYVKSSGKWSVDNGFIQKEIHRTVDAFGNIAHVFSTFESFHSKEDPKPFMRGINSIELLNDGKRWWIINILWDNENRRNPIPRNYLPK